ncbi:MAG TPA: hypothetical protein VLT45_28835 [Kofleriaceae bacterium]|nr:hypothetical protein [Kofleriaceae bacterium]
MRPLRLAIALSAAVHGGALAWVATHPAPKPEAPPPVTTTVEIIPAPAPPPEEPVAVALLDDHSTVPTGPATAAATRHATGHSHAISTGGGQGGTSETPATPGTTGTHSPLMGMRGGEKKQLHWDPSANFNAAFAAYEATHPPDIPPPPSGELKPSGGGTYTSDQPAFKVRIDRDGTAHIDDKPDVGGVHFDGLGIGGRASFDDWAMRRAGIDPYASAKRQWLDKTRDERARIGMAARKEDLARAPEFMKRNVHYAWSRTANDAEARKQALFELWDDCAETGEADLVAAGAAARTYLVGFIRAHLPAGSPGAFTPEDLSRMNAHKRSHATFQPY